MREMASEMEETNLLMKLADRDLIAIEANYHLACLMKYRNQYHSHIRNSHSSSDVQKGKSHGFC